MWFSNLRCHICLLYWNNKAFWLILPSFGIFTRLLADFRRHQVYTPVYVFTADERKGRQEWVYCVEGGSPTDILQQHLTFTYKGITIHNLTLAADNLNTAHPHTAEIGIRREVSEWTEERSLVSQRERQRKRKLRKDKMNQEGKKEYTCNSRLSRIVEWFFHSMTHHDVSCLFLLVHLAFLTGYYTIWFSNLVCWKSHESLTQA